MLTPLAPEPEVERAAAPKSSVKVLTATRESARENAAQQEIESLKSQLKQATAQAPTPFAGTSATPASQSKTRCIS